MIGAISYLARLGRAGFVFAREGVFGLVDPWVLPVPGRAALRLARLIERPQGAGAANRLSAALTRLGPTYVKLGQFLATRPDVVGVALARDLESLQDKMAPFPQPEAERAVEAALDKPLRQVFASFGSAVAAASIAQVHLAAAGGRSVAVKVLRPAIEHRFNGDLDAFTFAAFTAERLFAEARRLRLMEVVETLRRSVLVEMDFRLEAAALSEMAEKILDDAAAELGQIEAGRFEPRAVVQRNAVDPFKRQHFLGGPVPVDSRNAEIRVFTGVVRHLGERGRFESQIHFDGDGAAQCLDDFDQPESAGIGE